MLKLFEKIKMRSKAINAKMEQAQEAVAFAEANLSTRAIEDPAPAVPISKGKLLVIGNESMFSKNVVNYALEMAQRMSFEIVALNTAPLSCDTFKHFSSSQKQICQRFQSDSAENVRAFKEAAETDGIPFTHVVKFSEPDQALEAVQNEISNIEFVVSDDQSESSVERVADVERPTNRVLVYSMI